MNKPLLIILLLFTLTSCFWENKEGIKINEQKIEKELIFLPEKVENNEEIIVDEEPKFDKSLEKETGDFIEKLNINPDILKKIKCEDLLLEKL